MEERLNVHGSTAVSPQLICSCQTSLAAVLLPACPSLPMDIVSDSDNSADLHLLAEAGDQKDDEQGRRGQ